MIRMGYYTESCNGSRVLVNNIVVWLKKKKVLRLYGVVESGSNRS